MRSIGLAAALLAVPALAAPATALARVDAAVTLAGPDAAIVELGGVAMAPDGTGGIVWTRFEEGRTHVFAARYDGTAWSPPQRVDAGQRWDSRWARIAAGLGGRLVVTWVQDGGEGADRLYSAALPPGGARFQPPTAIDLRVGEATATMPSIAMAPGGNALLAYRVVTATASESRDLPTGYVKAEIRLARFDGWRWRRFGAPVNRIRSAPMREPGPAAAPRIAIAPNGNGAVAWQETDERLVDRVWVRRVFDARVSVPLQASPARVGEASVDGHADALALDATPLGRVVVATRQQPGPRDRGAAPRLFLAELPESTDADALRFTGGAPQPAEPAQAGAPGPPSVALGSREDVLVGFARGGQTVLGAGEGATLGATGAGAPDPAADPGPPALDAGAAGRGTLAVASAAGGGRVVVQQLDRAGVTRTQEVSASGGGPIRAVAVAGAGSGDALVAFAQGEPDRGQIAVARVEAPPVPFALLPPGDWTRERDPVVAWDPAPEGLRPRFYTLSVDGRAVVRTRGTEHRFAAGSLGEGVHELRLVATGRTGETTEAEPRTLSIDRTPPTAVVRLRGRRAVVRILDGRRGEVAGPAPESSTIAWGDGRTSEGVSGRAAHAYRPGGPRVRRIVVRALDAAGNASTTRLTITLPRASAQRRSTGTKEQQP